ncbi:BfmA/BtgA family mobilization protein [Zunongwangia sp. F363]|uniref:BfmA/BtgA family mobilization protein n=1 Tax=Autumnicola tepida TaxID=3075595 RepID=A0ABU3C794_9FLAO|nr:BfmA/BtgA family mobilization protein [Zunongwangia sp. F363]MDT0642210.1 BfmA/BtgA family mobilization protein [Zunongwangia sp. F363]
MDTSHKKEPFETFKLKASVGRKFRKYARHLGCSQSMTLLLMLEFFETNKLSPKEHMGPHMQTLERLVKKRIDALIAIVRSIEKNQTKPTALMLQSLFEEEHTPSQPKFKEKKFQAKEEPVQFREKKSNN